MNYDVKHYTYLRANCPRCGRSVDGWRSLPNPKKPYYQREGYHCLECGYSYFWQEKKLTCEDAAKYKGNLGFISTSARCPNCTTEMNFRLRKWEIPTHKNSWSYELEYICFECGFWHTEGVSQLTLEEVNQRRNCERLSPLSHL